VFRFDRATKRTERISDQGAAAEAASASMSADGRFIAYGVATTNIVANVVRVHDLERDTVSEFPMALSPSLSPDGARLAYVTIEQPVTNDSPMLLEVRDLNTNTVLWQARVSRNEDFVFGEGKLAFSANGRWLAFNAQTVEGIDCPHAAGKPGLDSPFVHDLETGGTACLALPGVLGGEAVDVGFVAVSGERLAVPFMAGVSPNPVGSARIVGAGLAVFSLATGEVIARYESDDLSLCCGGPPALGDGVLAWGPWRTSGIDVFEPFPAEAPLALTPPAYFDAPTTKFSQPALSADGRHLAYVVSGRDVASGQETAQVYVVTRQ
jgi:hypothetical protein